MDTVAGSALKWAPRLASLLVGGAYLALLAAEVWRPHAGPPSNGREWLGIVLMSVAALAPLAAWKWQIQGALLSLTALLGFVLLVPMRRYDPMIVMALPALLFVADWALRRPRANPSA